MARWTKGQSGNPGGRPKDSELREAARAHTKDAIATLVSVMKNKKAPAAARVTAACALLDRGYGKPNQAITGEDGEPLTIRIVRLADDDADTAG